MCHATFYRKDLIYCLSHTLLYNIVQVNFGFIWTKVLVLYIMLCVTWLNCILEKFQRISSFENDDGLKGLQKDSAELYQVNL